MPKTALIVGVTGQDGSYLAELLLAKGYVVHGMMRRSSSFNTDRVDHLYRDPREDDCRFFLHHGDLLDPMSLRKILTETQPDEVYNLGCQSHVRVSFDVPIYTVQAAGLGALALLEAIRDTGLSTRFYQASSSEMFGSSPPPQNESTPFHPRSPYACAKAYAYWQTINYREAYGMFACNGILFNHECVTAETPVVILRDGLVDVLPIEELVPHRENPKHGKKYTTEPSKPFEVWDRDGWTRVRCMTATWADREVVDVRTRSSSFSVTPDHIVFDANGAEIHAEDIVAEQRLAMSETALLPQETAMTEEEAWLLGAIVADGYIKDQHGRFTKNDEEIRSLVSAAWRRVSGGNSRQGQTTSGFSDALVSTVEFSGAPDYLRCIQKQIYTERRQKKVPIRVLNGSREIQMAFLSAYNSCDGLKKGHGNYEFKSWKTNSPTLAAGLWILAHNVLQQRTILCVEDRDCRKYFTINLNTPNGGKKGAHRQRPLNEVVRVKKTNYRGWVFDLETESGTFHAGVGTAWIHNSPRRGETFVTRKITMAAARIKLGLQDVLYLGNLDARRDWGFAGDYVEAMWSMLQQDTPDDYVIATGESHSVQEFLELTFSSLDLDWREYVQIDDRHKRPAEVDHLEGDASKARRVLGWEPATTFPELVRMMVESDLDLARRERILADAV